MELIAESYPDPISFARMQQKSDDLKGENQSRLKKKLPKKCAALVKSIRGRGYTLKLPLSRS